MNIKLTKFIANAKKTFHGVTCKGLNRTDQISKGYRNRIILF